MPKTDLKYENKNLHMSEFVFCYNNSLKEFITGSSDCLIKFLPIEDSTARETIDEQNEVTAIASGLGKIFYSQETKLNMAEISNKGIFNPKDSILLSEFTSNIRSIQLNEKLRSIACFSEDDDIQIIDVDELKVFKYKTIGEVSLKKLLYSKSGKYLFTSGCDGVLTMYALKGKGVLNLKGTSNCFSKTTLENKKKANDFDYNEKVVALSGDILLRVCNISESGIGEVRKIEEISHNTNIRFVRWVDENILLTFDEKNCIKIWNYEEKKLLFEYEEIKLDITDIMVILLQNDTQFAIVFSDKDGSINISEPINISKEDKPDKDNLDMYIDEILEEDEKRKKEEAAKENPKKDHEEEPLDISDIEDEDGNIRNKEEIKQRLEEKKELQKDENDQYLTTMREQLKLCELQEPFISSCTIGDGEVPRYLCCNLTGRIISRKDHEFKTIDVFFSDTTNKKNISFIDTNDFHLGVLNNIGILFGNKVEEENLDEYENEDKIREARIEFKTVQNTGLSILSDWTFKFPPEENPILLGIGSDFCCAYTSMSYLRIFSIFGGEKYKFSISTNIISITCYENFLAYVYHVSLPFSNTQQLRMKILDGNKLFTEVYDGELAITPEANLIWFGFSEEGILISYDSFNILRGFFLDVTTNWVPLLDLGEKYSGTNINFWVVGVEDGEVYGIEMKGDTIEPPADAKPIQKTFKIIGEDNTEWTREQFLADYYLITFLEKKYHKFIQIKNIRTVELPQYYFTEYLKDESDIKKLKKEHDKKVLRAANLLIIKGENSEVINYFEYLLMKKSREILINMCNEYNKHELVLYLSYKNRQIAINELAAPQQQVIIQDQSCRAPVRAARPERDEGTLASLAINLKDYQTMENGIKNELLSKGVIKEEKSSKSTKNKDKEPINKEEDQPTTEEAKVNLNLFSKTNNENSTFTKHDLFSELSKLNCGNHAQKNGSKAGPGLKRKHQELNKELPFGAEMIKGGKKYKK